jgi:outer membrane protein assembly factor BamB
VVLISYVPRDHVDLRKLSPELPSDATVVDGEVQEVDRNGKLKWSWSTKDHIALSESSRWHQVKPVRLRDHRVAYDIVHLNSVDVEGKRVVVSMRHTDAVYEIDKPTGNVLWKLGGTQTLQSLTFANDPFGADSFGGQHDARLTADGRYLTLFDNGTLRNRPPRAVRYSIDGAARTATLLQSVTDPAVSDSLCCGSARLLPGGDWVISWGGNFVVTEADPAGHRVLALGFAGERQSYRAIPILPGTLRARDFRTGMDAQAP